MTATLLIREEEAEQSRLLRDLRNVVPGSSGHWMGCKASRLEDTASVPKGNRRNGEIRPPVVEAQPFQCLLFFRAWSECWCFYQLTGEKTGQALFSRCLNKVFHWYRALFPTALSWI